MFHQRILSGEMLPGIAVDDGAALHYTDRDMFRVVTSRANARAYTVKADGGQISEQALEATYVGIAT